MNDLIVGSIGTGLLLFCFLLNQLNILKNNSPYYDGFNFIGAVFLTYFAYQIDAWPFVILELVWAGVSLRDLMRDVAHVA